MNFIKLFYHLFIFVSSYKYCHGEPVDFPLQVAKVLISELGLEVELSSQLFTNVELVKFDSPETNDRTFAIINPQYNNIIGDQFTTSTTEITYMYKLRMILTLFKENSFVIYTFDFSHEILIQKLFWSIRSKQPRPSQYLYAPWILKYPRDDSNDMSVMKEKIDFHVHRFEKINATWQTYNFTELADVDNGTYEGTLIFIPNTFRISAPLDRKKFALCIEDIPDEIFIVIFGKVTDGDVFNAALKDQQNDKMDPCEFPNLTNEQKDYIMWLDRSDFVRT